MVSVRSETRNQHGDVLQVATVRIVVPRRPGASKAARMTATLDPRTGCCWKPPLRPRCCAWAHPMYW